MLVTPSETRLPSGLSRLESGPIGADLGFLLARANAVSVATASAALAPFELSVRSYAVLSVVSDDARPTQRELADFLRLDPSQIVALVDALETRGLVERRQDPADRRANVVLVTAAGADLAAAARASVATAEAVAYRGLTEDEQRELASLLRRAAIAD